MASQRQNKLRRQLLAGQMGSHWSETLRQAQLPEIARQRHRSPDPRLYPVEIDPHLARLPETMESGQQQSASGDD